MNLSGQTTTLGLFVAGAGGLFAFFSPLLGKMISPQNLAIAASAVGLQGREGDLFRRVLGWSLGFVLFMCALVFLQSTPVLGWMVVD